MSLFQERLQLLKGESGETQAKIASDIGITPQALSYYMNGREPNYDVLIQIAKYFSVTVDYLLGTSNSRNPDENVRMNADIATFEDGLASLSVVDREKVLDAIKNIFQGYSALSENRKAQKKFINCLWSIMGILSTSSMIACEISPLQAKADALKKDCEPSDTISTLVQAKAYCQFNIEDFYRIILKSFDSDYLLSSFEIPDQFGNLLKREAIKAAKIDLNSPSLSEKDKQSIIRFREIYANEIGNGSEE